MARSVEFLFLPFFLFLLVTSSSSSPSAAASPPESPSSSLSSSSPSPSSSLKVDASSLGLPALSPDQKIRSHFPCRERKNEKNEKLKKLKAPWCHEMGRAPAFKVMAFAVSFPRIVSALAKLKGREISELPAFENLMTRVSKRKAWADRMIRQKKLEKLEKKFGVKVRNSIDSFLFQSKLLKKQKQELLLQGGFESSVHSKLRGSGAGEDENEAEGGSSEGEAVVVVVKREDVEKNEEVWEVVARWICAFFGCDGSGNNNNNNGGILNAPSFDFLMSRSPKLSELPVQKGNRNERLMAWFSVNHITTERVNLVTTQMSKWFQLFDKSGNITVDELPRPIYPSDVNGSGHTTSIMVNKMHMFDPNVKMAAHVMESDFEARPIVYDVDVESPETTYNKEILPLSNLDRFSSIMASDAPFSDASIVMCSTKSFTGFFDPKFPVETKVSTFFDAMSYPVWSEYFSVTAECTAENPCIKHNLLIDTISAMIVQIPLKMPEGEKTYRDTPTLTIMYPSWPSFSFFSTIVWDFKTLMLLAKAKGTKTTGTMKLWIPAHQQKYYVNFYPSVDSSPSQPVSSSSSSSSSSPSSPSSSALPKATTFGRGVFYKIDEKGIVIQQYLNQGFVLPSSGSSRMVMNEGDKSLDEGDEKIDLGEDDGGEDDGGEDDGGEDDAKPTENSAANNGNEHHLVKEKEPLKEHEEVLLDGSQYHFILDHNASGEAVSLIARALIVTPEAP